MCSSISGRTLIMHILIGVLVGLFRGDVEGMGDRGSATSPRASGMRGINSRQRRL